MRQEHIDAIQTCIRECNSLESGTGVFHLNVLRDALVAIFEHLCQHEENHLVTGGEDISVTAARILAANPSLDRRSTDERNGARNIEP